MRQHPARVTSCTAGRPTTILRRTRTPRQTADPWSVRGAKGLLCVVPLGPGRCHAPHTHAPGGRTAIKGHWLAACTVVAHATAHCAMTLVTPSPRHACL
jgi:hypothetical protein